MTTPGDSVIAPGNPAIPVVAACQIRIAERSPTDPDAFALLHAFHREQIGRYGFADPVELSPGDYTPPKGVFAIVYEDAALAGCGGYRWYDRATCTVEIKKLYVLPAARGHGGGRTLLTWLEQHAIAAGAERAILETGVRNRAAIGLFTSTGYRPMDRYVKGRDPAINRAFARPLRATHSHA